MPGRIRLDVDIGRTEEASAQPRIRGEKMRILVMGDFSVRRNRADEQATEIADRASIAVDLDSFDAAMTRLRPRLLLDAGEGETAPRAIEFRSLDDFHPDGLYRTLDAFDRLRASRGRLLDPASFEQEAAALLRDLPPATVAGTVATDAATGAGPADDAAPLLQALLGTPPSRPAPRKSASDVVENLVAKIVRPHVVAAPSASSAVYVSALDAAASGLMRRVLHDSDFQRLEANWRGVRRLIETLDPGDDLELRILDVSQQELIDDLRSVADQPERSAAYRLLAGHRADATEAPPWSLLVGLYSFGPDESELALLTHLGSIAARVGAPFLAGAAPGLLGCVQLNERSDPSTWRLADPEIAQRWATLRASPASRWIGLALPRVLARLPYGARSDAVESFGFEELAGADEHENYVWGNPALACAEVVGLAFREHGAEFDLSGPLEVTDLPAHTRDEDGEKTLQACAEHFLSLRVGDEILARGLMPVLSFRDRNAARILRFQSLGDPAQPLAGLG